MKIDVVIASPKRKKMNESRRGKKRDKYKKTYTTWYIGTDRKRFYIKRGSK